MHKFTSQPQHGYGIACWNGKCTLADGSSIVQYSIPTVPGSPISNATDRRTHLRVDVKWPITLRRDDGCVVTTFTRNVSSRGFYCYSLEAFSEGDMLTCIIEAPAWKPGETGQKLLLNCTARVVWTERIESEQCFGIACEIQDYSVVTAACERARSL